MSKTVEIKCDACGVDLSDAGSMPTYRLALSAEHVPNSGSVICDVMVYPPIDHQHHLDLWLDRRK